MNLKVIAFDADDTLFVNETYFEETEKILSSHERLPFVSKLIPGIT